MNLYRDDEASTDAVVLRETLTRVENLTEQIQKSLGKICSESSRAEEQIRPIASQTRRYEVIEKNMGETIAAAAEIKTYTKITEDCRNIITKDISITGIGTYTGAIMKVMSARKEMESDVFLRIFTGLLGDMKSLAEQGQSNAKRHFAEMLSEVYTPLDIGPYIENQQMLPRITENQFRPLREMLEFFNKCKINVEDIYYDTVRKFFTASSAPSAEKVRFTFEARATHIDGMKTYTFALMEICIWISQDLKVLIEGMPPNTWASSKEQLFESVVTRFEKQVSDLYEQNVRFNQSQQIKDYNATIELIGFIANVENCMKSLIDHVPSSLTRLADKIKSKIVNHLVEILKSIETTVQAVAKLPDNGVANITIETMSRLSKLANSRPGVVEVLRTATYGSWMPSPKPAWATALPPITETISNPYEMLCAYFSDALDDLLLNLEFKSKALGRKNGQTGLFLLTNIAFAESYAKKELAAIMGDTGRDRLDRLRRRFINLFLEDWRNLASILMDVTVVKPGSKQLSSKDRDAIKEKFRTFNAEFESLVQRHKSIGLSDPLLKKQLGNEIYRLIGPLYHRFHDKHMGGDFTKNIDKYIKYNNAQFDDVMRSLGWTDKSE